MVFQFEHVGLDHGRDQVGRAARCGCSTSRPRSAAGRRGSPSVGWNSLYWNNHDQPRAVSRFGDDGPSTASRSAKMLGTVLHLHRGTPYVYQGEELGMTNARVRRHRRRSSTSSRSTTTREAIGRRRRPGRVLRRRCGRRAATTPARRCSGTRGRTPASRPATPWLPVNPNHPQINAAAAVADPDSVFHHYRRLIALRHDEPVGRARRLHDAAAGRRAGLRVHPPARRRRAARCSATSPARGGARSRSTTGWARRAGAGQLRRRAAETGVLRPWEARVLRRGA